MRLRLFAAAGAALALASLAACSPSSSDTSPPDEAPISEAAPESEAPASEAAPIATPAPEVKTTGQNASVDRFGEPQFEDGADVEDIAATGDTRRRDPTPPPDATDQAATPVEGQ